MLDAVIRKGGSCEKGGLCLRALLFLEAIILDNLGF